MLFMQSSNINIKIQNVLDKIWCFVDNSIWRGKYSYAIRNLQEEINAPCVLAIAGKVKAGKSYLVNALLGIDLAMTGNTETTATVNIFKKGVAPDKNKPILCIYLDGHKEWVSKDFLYSLQGTSAETLDRTSQIDKLIIYIDDNPLLDNVTLVDTPGIGAEVGEDGDSHQVHTEAYFQLRNRHERETIDLSHSADAIIYLFNTVPTETDKKFLLSLYNNGTGITSLNGIGVLAKVDKDLTQIDNIKHFRTEFEHNLFTILPSSATLNKYLPTFDFAQKLQKCLHEGFQNEQGFNLALGSETAFLHENLPYCNMSVFERKSLLKQFAETDLAWSSFVLIVRELYYSNNLNASLSKLRDIAGIQNIRNTLYNHFFERSHMLRGNKILGELRKMMNGIEYDESFVRAEYYANMKSQCLNSCQTLSQPINEIMQQLIESNIPSIGEVQDMKQRFFQLKGEVETLQNELQFVNDCFLMYHEIMANQEQFNQLELEELQILFAGQETKNNAFTRYKYWAGVYNISPANGVRQRVAKLAKIKYAKLFE